MTTPSATSATPTPTLAVAVEAAKAYCGAAHGQSCILDAAAPVPEWVDFDAAGGMHPYRLVHDPRRAHPARDDEGNNLYMPAGYGSAASAAGPLAVDACAVGSFSSTAPVGRRTYRGHDRPVAPNAPQPRHTQRAAERS